ncbi:MAG: response regulator [Desulfobacteraceae bacterium]|jgi:DNA-binding NtrC family response regulator
MVDKNKLGGKRILIVDDEPDILESLEELLDMCVIDKAADFETAKELLEKNNYDAAILDIMGVYGYDLLEITTKKDIPTLMLTAHALDPENFVKSIKKGALAYIPKDKISEIETFLEDILEAHEKGMKKLGKWFARLEPFFVKKFGAYWEQKIKEDPDFWKKYV